LRVGLALSGGTDSAAAARLLLGRGHQVKAFVFSNSAHPDNGNTVEEARTAARRLGLTLTVVDAAKEFQHLIDAYIVPTLMRNETPNPCVVCNRRIKFSWFMQRVLQDEDVELFATGHYAGSRGPRGQAGLFRGADKQKDQSYFLAQVEARAFRRTLFPLSRVSKQEAVALAAGIVARPHTQSQDVCFARNYRMFIREHLAGHLRPGPIVHVDGREIGRHQGLPLYTIGQRRGLGVAFHEPLYVVNKRTHSNCLVVGVGRDLLCRDVVINNLNLLAAVGAEGRGWAKIRYNQQAQAVRYTCMRAQQRALLRFAAPVSAPAPGQLAVVFDAHNRQVLFSGYISGGE